MTYDGIPITQGKLNLVRVIGRKITVLTDQRETSQFWFESHREV